METIQDIGIVEDFLTGRKRKTKEIGLLKAEISAQQMKQAIVSRDMQPSGKRYLQAT